jgi:hypothetical protein
MTRIAEIADRLRRLAKRREDDGIYTDASLCTEAAELLTTPANPAQGVIERAREIIKANTDLPPDGISSGLFDNSGVMRCTVAALTAAIGSGGQAVALKPLDWRNGCASTSIGDYLVVEEDWDDEPFWFVMLNGKTLNKLGEHRDEASAIAAAQADYERRILSAIAHPVQPGWRDIESAPREHGHMILAPNRYGVVDTICWNDAANDCKGGWDDGCYGDDLPPYDPEIWMPVPVLPAAPQPKGE